MTIGEKRGKLTCIGKDKTRDFRYYLFQCECGNVKSIIKYNVENGSTRSCGCLKRENPNHTTHGLSHTRIDNIYRSMIDRCKNPNNKRYCIYGAKGIRVCEEWENDKTTFFEWSFANGYADNLTIDRIDNSKGYEPSNCRWATYEEQGNNKTTNHFLKYNGERRTIRQWEKYLGFKKGLIHSRLRRGWSVEKTLTTAVRQGG